MYMPLGSPEFAEELLLLCDLGTSLLWYLGTSLLWYLVTSLLWYLGTLLLCTSRPLRS